MFDVWVINLVGQATESGKIVCETANSSDKEHPSTRKVPGALDKQSHAGQTRTQQANLKVHSHRVLASALALA